MWAWLHCVLLAAVCSLPLTTGDSEEVQVVCVGKDFRLPVYSVSRVVTFTPSSPPGPRRVLLDRNHVKDSRFQWTRDRMLVLTGVNHSDQGLYSIKLSSGFTYETVRLSVSECISSFRRSYGETFQNILPHDVHVLEFTARGSDPDTPPVVLWNRSDPEVGVSSLWGRVVGQDGGQVMWVVPRVNQRDHQGNYTARDDQRRALWRGELTVHGHTSNVTHFTQESVSLRLLLPLSQSQLIFTPTQEPEGGPHPWGPFDPRPPRGPVVLLTGGHVADHLDLRYRGRVSVGAGPQVTISRLTVLHDGMYDVRDQDGNLVSSTTLTVVDRAKWRAVLKSISVPSGMFVSLAGFILFLNCYPQCTLADLIHSLTVNPRNAKPQDDTPRKSSPDHMRYTPVIVTNGSPVLQHDAHRPTNGSPALQHDVHRPANGSPALQHDAHRPTNGSPAHQTTTTEKACNVEHEERQLSSWLPGATERQTSFSLPGATDCLQSSSECARFQISEDVWRRTPQSFLPLTQQDPSGFPLSTLPLSALPLTQQGLSTFPLDTDTSGSCSVFTSHKLSLS